MKIYNDITELIGNTPMLFIEKYKNINKLKGNIFLKLEKNNPSGSIKDRVAYQMIDQAEKEGIINKKTTVIEATSGNTGIGLASICALKNYKLILTMPENMSIERQKLLKAYNAEIILTPKELGMSGAVEKAKELNKKIKNSFIAEQFKNVNNVLAHKKTAEEIWNQMDEKIDVLVCGIGTGGTISGVGKYLKEKNNEIEIIGIEPNDSPFITRKVSGQHLIQGIGAGFIPEILDLSIIDKVFTIKTDQAYSTVLKLAKEEGMLLGITSGASLFIAQKLASQKKYKDKNIIVIAPDSGERYLSTDLFL